MLRSLPLLLLLSAGLAAASPSADVAQQLAEGKLDADAAAAAWTEAGVAPDDALDALATRSPKVKLSPGIHEVELKDGNDRASTAFVMIPKTAWKKGKYRVLVMLHGSGGNGRKTFELAASLAPKGTIVVGPTALKPLKTEKVDDLPDIPIVKKLSARFPRWWSYRQTGFALHGLRMILRDYPVDTDRIVLIGYSMGGFGTWNLGLRFHDRFAGAAPLAGGISRSEYAGNFLGRDTRSRFLLGNARMQPLYILHGDRDEVVPVFFDRWTVEDLKKQDLPYVYREVKNGPHVMRKELQEGPVRRELLGFVGSCARDAHPKRVEHLAIDADHSSAYWVRLDEVKGKARVVALAKKQTIQVVVAGSSKLTLYLDPQVVDPSKPVRVVVNGKERFQGLVKPSTQAVAETFARTLDPKLTYTHALTLDLGTTTPPSAEDWRLGLGAGSVSASAKKKGKKKRAKRWH